MKSELSQRLFDRFNFFNPDGDIRHTLIPFGIECGDGWFGIIWDLCEAVEREVKTKNIEGFEVVQVKEKFGGLRFYCDNSTHEILELVRIAEEKSYKTCEVCGKPGKVRNNGWISTLCDEHAKDS